MRHGISPVRFRPLLTAATIDSALRRRRIQHRGNFDQQVMSAQPTTARAPVLQGETSGPNYGAADVQQAAQAALPGQEAGMGRGDHQLLNGVDPRGTVGAREEPPRAGPRVPEQSQGGHVLTTGMETMGRTEQAPTLRTTSRGEQRLPVDKPFVTKTRADGVGARRAPTASGRAYG